jgi:hypothetical protein
MVPSERQNRVDERVRRSKPGTILGVFAES